jgi:hypothetical protein
LRQAARGKQRWQRVLHGRADGQKDVCDVLEAQKHVANEPLGPSDGRPRQFHLWQAGELRQPAQTEREHIAGFEGGARATRIFRQPVRREYFVGYDREAELGHRAELVTLQERARRIVGADDQHGSRARRARGAQRFQVDVPCAIVGQPVAAKLHAFERGQLLEQWVARPRHEHLVPWIAE